MGIAWYWVLKVKAEGHVRTLVGVAGGVNYRETVLEEFWGLDRNIEVYEGHQ